MNRYLLIGIAAFWICINAAFAADKYESKVISTFSRSAVSTGVWKGRVQGRGLLGLRLFIYRDGRLESNRYLGKVKLARKDSSSFTFTTPIPRDSRWSWKLVAVPLQA